MQGGVTIGSRFRKQIGSAVASVRLERGGLRVADPEDETRYLSWRADAS
jgi:hypothetical protein